MQGALEKFFANFVTFISEFHAGGVDLQIKVNKYKDDHTFSSLCVGYLNPEKKYSGNLKNQHPRFFLRGCQTCMKYEDLLSFLICVQEYNFEMKVIQFFEK